MQYKAESICAVVVTYNRRDLLLECLDAIINQTQPVQAIYIIDNHSNDGTNDFLYKNNYINKLPPSIITEPWVTRHIVQESEKNIIIEICYVYMHENTGGAGGFHEGVKRAYEENYEWLWLMDDDTIASKAALQNLVIDKNKFSIFKNYEIGFNCSRVLWKNYKPHKMNVPEVLRPIDKLSFYEFYSAYTPFICLKFCSFVSILINKKAIDKVGYPYKDFFIWQDDVEFTSRITNNNFLGLLNLDSIAYHKTESNYSTDISSDSPKNAWKYYYNYRNSIYRIKLNPNFSGIFSISRIFINTLIQIMRRKNSRLLFLNNFIRGFIKGIISMPKI